jgi:hypothetical protein
MSVLQGRDIFDFQDVHPNSFFLQLYTSSLIISSGGRNDNMVICEHCESSFILRIRVNCAEDEHRPLLLMPQRRSEDRQLRMEIRKGNSMV